MNKVIAIVVGILIIGSGAFILLGGEDDTATTQTQETTTQTSTRTDPAEMTPSSDTAEEAPVQTASAGGYVDYSEQALADSSGNKQVVFFHATWCSTCNFFEGQIEDQGVPDGVTVLKADFDRDTELKDQYGVNVQSTFVLLDENGEVEQTWPFASGLRSIQDLYSAVLEA